MNRRTYRCNAATITSVSDSSRALAIFSARYQSSSGTRKVRTGVGMSGGQRGRGAPERRVRHLHEVVDPGGVGRVHGRVDFRADSVAHLAVAADDLAVGAGLWCESGEDLVCGHDKSVYTGLGRSQEVPA